jgi:hypothetical protein
MRRKYITWGLVLCSILVLNTACSPLPQPEPIPKAKEFRLDDDAIKSFYEANKENLIIPASVEYEFYEIHYEADLEWVKETINDWKGASDELQDEIKKINFKNYLYSSAYTFYYFNKSTHKEKAFGESLMKAPVGSPYILTSPAEKHFSDKFLITMVRVLKKTEKKELPFDELKDKIYNILATYSEEDAKVYDKVKELSGFNLIPVPIGESYDDVAVDKKIIEKSVSLDEIIQKAKERNDWRKITKTGDKILEEGFKDALRYTYFTMGDAYYETKQYKKAIISYHLGDFDYGCANCLEGEEYSKYTGLLKAYDILGDIPACIRYSILLGDIDMGKYKRPDEIVKKYNLNMKRIIAGAKIIVSSPDLNFPSRWTLERMEKAYSSDK